MGRRPASLRPLWILLAALQLTACGFQPLYGGSSSSSSLPQHYFRDVYVAEIDNALAGQSLRNRLIDIMGTTKQTPEAPYILAIGLEIVKEGLAIQPNDNVTRVNLRLVARYRLVHRASGKLSTNGSVRTISSYNVIRSDYANLFSERDAVRRAAYRAADEIRARVAVLFTTQRSRR